MILSQLFSQWKNKHLLKSQASLDQLWIAGYTQGFSKAWDMMVPLMTDGVMKMKEAIRTEAINETLQNLAPTHQLYTAQTTTLRPVVDLLKKREEFSAKADAAVGAEGEKYKHYIAAIDWALSSPNGH